ncbi:class I SAM-dependent methyltransferase [Pseudobacteriovorax antillogorgiicola]|uniref:Methyltransferase domain-containing protein n=1 Tax=Pseudobacteriovorax antillogorgiicola TaxID=1513793 RepID=A0A1Y6BTX2_9BACT|nr:class I SAM-dependent methyltransferase [Pseudobacteriovorax antillogorgiicola]TCS53883.1 hypothetical protein EDD56_107192 [Pseudobacteriovorax antillogorgiicola]SMF21053.1 hypothetical protein SAMN06296036_10780 [Pseudobacteriovorax antillogorgiicola]
MKDFDKYEYYQKAVQSPDADSEFMARVYRELREGREAKTLVEDFCAAFALCCEWVKLDDDKDAIGIDLDPEPVAYGRDHYLTELSEEQKNRIKILEANVMEKDLPKGDIIAALNFSYFGFKERPLLLDYFKSCYHRLHDDGLLILDCFGGPACMEPNEHETEYDDFSYFWDQDTYHPLSNHAQFYIHFKRKGEKKRKKVFSYDWRLWSIAELKDLLQEAGFSKSVIYWEGTDEDGDGDGNYTLTEDGEQCESYVAYVIGIKS